MNGQQLYAKVQALIGLEVSYADLGPADRAKWDQLALETLAQTTGSLNAAAEFALGTHHESYNL